MANKILLYSSIIHGLILLTIFYFYYNIKPSKNSNAFGIEFIDGQIPPMITSIHNTDKVGVINAPNLQRYNNGYILPFSIFIVVVTSILNHGFTNDLLKCIDRLASFLVIGIVLYIIYVTPNFSLENRLELFIGIMTASCILLVSKMFHYKWQTRLHLLSHILGTIIIATMILSFL
jgi:hypothetical protein